ncbi:MAG: hypothetical protein LBT93_04640 [Treponema sp.]|jgi:uncharacterized membrane protein|nr:hypothetical protein [Treponema sp.]
MDLYRPLRVVLFIYELLRLVLVVGITVGFMPPEENGMYYLFPYVVYVVPNALFPLMTLFLWLRLEVYRPYLALYMAGKTIAVVCAVVWAVFSIQTILGSLYIGSIDSLVVLGMVCCLFFTDLFSMLGAGFLQSRLKGTELPAVEYGGTECV